MEIHRRAQSELHPLAAMGDTAAIVQIGGIDHAGNIRATRERSGNQSAGNTRARVLAMRGASSIS